MRTLSLLIKPASSGCNMRCRYCFYSDVAKNRAVKNLGMMPDKLLETVVRKALSETYSHCVFGFQGGETTLAGLDFFHKLIAYEKMHNVNKIKISHTLQTNGILIDGHWARFLKENSFLVGLSIDASKQVHDEFRLDAAGNATHSRSMAAAKVLAEYNVDFNILSVVTRQLAGQPEKAYRFYKQNGFRHLQFIPCLDGLSEGSGASIYSLRAKSYGDFLCRIFDLWYADYIKNDYVSIRAFDNYIWMLAGQQPENCAAGGVCSAYALVEADGSVYPCDFYAMDGYLLGNVVCNSFKDMLRGEEAEAFIKSSRHVDQACRACEYGFMCRGGCRRDREPFVGGVPQLNNFCRAYKQFFAHALPRMRAISRHI